MSDVRLILGDCLEVLKTLPAGSVDAVVTDPPYGLSFMGKDWDHGIPGVAFWTEALRVAKPGAHMLAFGGTRTFHRLACAIEDAGWEIRDTVMWVYGQGFPKSLAVDKAIDKAAGAEREVVVGVGHHHATDKAWVVSGGRKPYQKGDAAIGEPILAPATPAALQWQGWGTALKPAWEPIIVARKPLQGTVAANVLAWGTGAINVDGCRIPTGDSTSRAFEASTYEGPSGYRTVRSAATVTGGSPLGRWPANLIHDGSEEVVGLMPTVKAGVAVRRNVGHSPSSNINYATGSQDAAMRQDVTYGDSGSAARFFYCVKASKADRDEGLDGMEATHFAASMNRRCLICGHSQLSAHPCECEAPRWEEPLPRRNHHPTVKPTALMRYLCRLVTPPGGVVLDPFMGSGSTGKAALQEGFRFTGIEIDSGYYAIAERRIADAQQQLTLPVAPPSEATPA